MATDCPPGPLPLTKSSSSSFSLSFGTFDKSIFLVKLLKNLNVDGILAMKALDNIPAEEEHTTLF